MGSPFNVVSSHLLVFTFLHLETAHSSTGRDDKKKRTTKMSKERTRITNRPRIRDATIANPRARLLESPCFRLGILSSTRLTFQFFFHLAVVPLRLLSSFLGLGKTMLLNHTLADSSRGEVHVSNASVEDEIHQLFSMHAQVGSSSQMWFAFSCSQDDDR